MSVELLPPLFLTAFVVTFLFICAYLVLFRILIGRLERDSRSATASEAYQPGSFFRLLRDLYTNNMTVTAKIGGFSWVLTAVRLLYPLCFAATIALIVWSARLQP